VVVHVAPRRHRRVERRGPDEAAGAPAQLARERARLAALEKARERRARDPPRAPRRLRLDAPHERGERARRLGERERSARVADRGLDLAAVAHDPAVGE